MATKPKKTAAKKALKKKLTKSQMRVAVAKDALKQIELEKYKACSGVYVDYELEDRIHESEPNSQVQDIIKKYTKPCEVCARGALLLSSIRKFNDVTVSKYKKKWESKSKQIFSKQTLSLAEIAFEEWTKLNLTSIEISANLFGRKYDNDEDRLKAILENIVANKGEFKP